MEKITSLSHLFITVFLSGFSGFMVIPAMTDVTMMALCPGQDECSLAIYLSGFQQATFTRKQWVLPPGQIKSCTVLQIIGIGAVIITPLIGNLSDKYGRKAMLTLPMTVSIIPLVILAYSRSKNFFYAYYAIRTLTAMVSDSSTTCLALAYVADYISPAKRASAFGVLSGVASASFVFGTLAARFLSPASTFQIAAFASIVAAVYMRIFLKESIPESNGLTEPLFKEETSISEGDEELPKRAQVFKTLPSFGDAICLLKDSRTLSQAAVISFFNGLAEGGMVASLMYFLKARFHFSKNQFADLMFVGGVVGTVSQLLLMPLLAPVLGEEKLLSVGLLVGCTNMFVNSISWSIWVPYVTTFFSFLSVFVSPTIRSIASKQVGPNEQGRAQGCISGINSFASIVSPLVFTPLTALFLSEKPPFNYPGFSIMCIGLASMMAFIQSLVMRVKINSSLQNTNGCVEG